MRHSPASLIPLDPPGSQEELLAAWRKVGLLILPFGLLAFIVGIYFEIRLGGALFTFDTISYAILSLFVILLYGVVSFRPSLIRPVVTLAMFGVTTYYLVKLAYALFVEKGDILANIAGNFAWTPAVIVVAFFAPQVRRISYLIIVLAVAIAAVAALYWVPNWIAGHDLATVQVFIQITLVMLFTACLVYAFALTSKHYSAVETAAERFQELALYDELTGLPNERHFRQQLERAVKEARQEGASVILAHLEVDRFDSIHRAYGEAVAGELLSYVAKRLQAHLSNQTFIARGQADTFTAITKGLSGEKEISHFGAQLLKAFDNPLYLESHQLELPVSASIGLSRYPQDATDAPGLERHARWALQNVKRGGRNGFSAGPLTHFAQDSLAHELRVELLRGFSWENFRLHYQPRFELVSNRLVGAEALLAWRSSVGWLPLGELRAMLSGTGDIVKIERAVLEHLCFDACRSSLADISFDISPLHFAQPDFVAFVRKIIASTGIDAERLVLELDFATLNSNPPLVRTTMQQLGEIGVRLVLDAFGQEFVASATLDALTLAGVKLHPKLFAAPMFTREQAAFTQTLLAVLIEQAHAVGLSVTAVGVENEVQVAALRNLGCDFAQGEWWGQPYPTMPGERLKEFS